MTFPIYLRVNFRLEYRNRFILEVFIVISFFRGGRGEKGETKREKIYQNLRKL